MGKLCAEDYEEGHICLTVATQLFKNMHFQCF